MNKHVPTDQLWWVRKNGTSYYFFECPKCGKKWQIHYSTSIIVRAHWWGPTVMNAVLGDVFEVECHECRNGIDLRAARQKMLDEFYEFLNKGRVENFSIN